VKGVLDKLDLAPSTHYKTCQHKTLSKQETRKSEVMDQIRAIYKASHQIYGAPKIRQELNKKGHCISEKTVGNYMREMGLKAHYIKPYTVTTIDSDFSNELRNILQRDFNPEKPNCYWCSDITYINTRDDGFVYLVSIMDLFSRKIIAWELSRDLKADAVVCCLRKAIANRKGIKAKVAHSDRGCQYVSQAYLEELGMEVEVSYSDKANPWDNACMESFHALIKREWLYRSEIKDYDHARRLIFKYINAFYNTVRIHSHCDYLSPDDFELQYDKLENISLNKIDMKIAC